MSGAITATALQDPKTAANTPCAGLFCAPADQLTLLEGLGLSVVGFHDRGALVTGRLCQSPRIKLFSLQVAADVTVEHTGSSAIVWLARQPDDSGLRGSLNASAGRRKSMHWREGEAVIGAVFNASHLRQGRDGAAQIASGLYDLSSAGASRTEALARLLTFFTSEASHDWSLLNTPAGLDYMETALFGLVAEAAVSPVTVATDTSPAPRHLRRAEAYIRDNLALELSVDELSRVAGVSERSLYRAFNDFRGLSIRAYVQNARMEAARRLLGERPELPLVEAARQVGYADYTSFWRHYRSQFGSAPSARSK